MLYIVTVRIDADIADEWQAWMQDVHVPDVMDTGCFATAAMVRCEDEDTQSRRAYRIVYRAHSEGAFQRYQDEFAEPLQAEHTERYERKFDAGRELLPVVQAWSEEETLRADHF
jgi:tellurite resistance protein